MPTPQRLSSCNLATAAMIKLPHSRDCIYCASKLRMPLRHIQPFPRQSIWLIRFYANCWFSWICQSSEYLGVKSFLQSSKRKDFKWIDAMVSAHLESFWIHAPGCCDQMSTASMMDWPVIFYCFIWCCFFVLHFILMCLNMLLSLSQLIFPNFPLS